MVQISRWAEHLYPSEQAHGNEAQLAAVQVRTHHMSQQSTGTRREGPSTSTQTKKH